MEDFEQNSSPKAVKKSPYADSIYECVYVEPEVKVRKVREKREKKGMPRVLKTVLVLVLMAICCVATAIGVTSVWQNRWNRMEAAVEEKFQALEQMYSQPQHSTSSQPVAQGNMTPSEVYAQNVDAVVAKLNLVTPDSKLVFMSNTNDTRYDAYGVMRPITMASN